MYKRQKRKEKVEGEGKKKARLVLLIIAAILLPPLCVGIICGCDKHLLISIILWLLFWIPGVIYALYILFTKD